MNYPVYLDLLALNDKCSFSEAAQVRGTTQPTLSHRIGQEEKMLGAKLFDRTARGLTPAGRIYVRHGNMLGESIEQLHQFAEGETEELVNFRAFSYIRTIAETGNITHAAEILYISQPALTQYMNSLEKNLGKKLVNRSRGHCTLTEDGERYCEIGKKCLEIGWSFQNDIDNHLRKSAARIRIALSRQTGSLLFSRVLPRYFEEYPDIQVDVTEADTDKARDLLITGKVDMAILLVPNLHSGMLRYTLLYEDELKIIMPEKYREKYPGPVVPPILLKNERFIMQQEYTAIQHIVNLGLNRSGLIPEVACRINLYRAVANLVAGGAGVAFFPGKMVSEYCSNCHVVTPDPACSYYLVYAVHERTEYGAHIARLMELLEQEVR